jgi:signal transduction histidine kinase
MNPILRVLAVDDSEGDVLLISRELRRAGFLASVRRVEDEPGMRTALDSTDWDVVLCDSSMPTFDAQGALALLAERQADIPLILVSGSPGPSPVALDAMRRGARHFVSKDELWRLPPLLASELAEPGTQPRLNVTLARALANAEELLVIRERLLGQQHWVALGRMTAGIVHDINNILSVVLACTAPLANAVGHEHPGQEYVEEIERATQRAATLTKRVLSVTQGQRSEVHLVDMNWVLDDLSTTLRRIVPKDIELVVALPLSLGWVRAEAGEIEQVILNLVTNARDAMGSGGRLTIAMSNVSRCPEHPSAPEGAPSLILSVTDTGAGIDPAIKDRIFELLFTTKGPRGTGIGLATVAAIVRRLGGTVGVDSEVGKGTTFRVYLPSAEAPGDGPGSVRPPDAPTGSPAPSGTPPRAT